MNIVRLHPTINNEDRALAALAAVEAYRNVRYRSGPTGDMEETISDLAGDLCHLAARHEIPPFVIMESGAAFYAAEAVEDTGNFLEVLVTLEVVARPNECPEEEDYQPFNDQSAALWRAQATALDED